MFNSKIKNRILILFFTLVLLVFPQLSNAQVADNVNSLELLNVIHTPTAGVLKQGQYQIDLDAFGSGGTLVGVSMGLFNRFMFGISYGGEGLIGYDEVKGNKLPGVLVKYRIFEESYVMPAITVGFDMQGKGAWYDSYDRYLFKAPGGFVAVSRNWISNVGRFGVHLGANYNTIEDEEQSVDGFAGIDFSLNEQLALNLEYDLGLDDKEEDGLFGEGKAGYLNAGIRMTFAQSLVLQFNVIDILNTSEMNDGRGREIRIVYVETFTL